MAPPVAAAYTAQRQARLALASPDRPGRLDAEQEAQITQLLRGVARAWDVF